jgi:DNA-binding Xre family transcriptional regulator
MTDTQVGISALIISVGISMLTLVIGLLGKQFGFVPAMTSDDILALCYFLECQPSHYWLSGSGQNTQAQTPNNFQRFCCKTPQLTVALFF